MTTLSGDADIVPNVGLGGLQVRAALAEVQDLVDSLPGSETATSYRMVGPFECRYTFKAPPVELGVDTRNGRIAKLIALPGYNGSLFGRIRVGMSVDTVMRLDPGIYYDEAEELLLCRDAAGIALDVEVVDPEPSTVRSLRVASITVYAEETMSAAGQRGEW